MMDEENPVRPVATRAWADAVRAWAPAGKSLIEKFSIGRLYDPIHARRMNKVRCKNYLQNVKTNLEVAQIKAQEKAINEQVNIDIVVQMAASMLTDSAKPEAIEQDWINLVCDKMRLVEDDNMRRLWAKLIPIVAGFCR